MFTLFRHGLSYAAIAKKVGLSRQRVQQIIRPPKPIYDLVKARAKGKCENCGIVVASGHVHHAHNGDKNFNDIANLQYLCPSCHRVQHSGLREEVHTGVGIRRTNLNIRDDQHEKLLLLSRKTGATMSALVRKALDAYLRRLP